MNIVILYFCRIPNSHIALSEGATASCEKGTISTKISKVCFQLLFLHCLMKNKTGKGGTRNGHGG